FAGPYYVAGQDLLVRTDDTSITGPDSLSGKKVCSVSGSTPAKRLKETYVPKGAKLQEFDAYSKCVAALLGGSVDAVSTDDIVLAGYAAQNAGKLKVVGKPFSVEKYGIGLAKDDKKGRDAVNDALQKIFNDGRYKQAWDKTLGLGGTPAPTPPTPDRYRSGHRPSPRRPRCPSARGGRGPPPPPAARPARPRGAGAPRRSGRRSTWNCASDPAPPDPAPPDPAPPGPARLGPLPLRSRHPGTARRTRQPGFSTPVGTAPTGTERLV